MIDRNILFCYVSIAIRDDAAVRCFVSAIHGSEIIDEQSNVFGLGLKLKLTFVFLDFLGIITLFLLPFPVVPFFLI